MRRLVGFTFFLTSLLLASAALHLSRQQPKVDYRPLAHCISDQSYRHPLEDQHQELVNALYACGVYKVSFG